jgi:hypothetical protein
MPTPPDYPTYPSRAQMVSYLESYAARFQVKPVFNSKVSRLRRDTVRWLADTGSHPLQSGLQPLRVLCIVALLLVALRMRNMPTCLYASALASREAGWANALL